MWIMFTAWLIRHLDPDWKIAHKLWSVRIAVFWTVLSSLWIALPSFQGMVDPYVFACISVGFGVAMLAGRLTNQPGLN